MHNLTGKQISSKGVSRAQETASRQLVIIDAAVAEHHLLAAGVEVGIEVLVLHPQEDGIAQITRALQNREIQTLHIIAHGESGKVHLGSSTVTVANLHTYTAHLRAWKQALGEAADILIYSCSVAAGLSGREFLEKLQQHLGTNIAAADRPVGNPGLGGTWKLHSILNPERSIPNPPFSAEILKAYPHTFSLSTQTTYAAGTASVSVAVGNFNSDTIPDLVVANYNNNNISAFLGNGSGGFSTQTTYAAGSGPRSVALGNFNGDTISDIAVANFGSNTISVLLGNGSGGFGTQTTYAAGTNPDSIAVGNFNGDTIPDLAVSNLYSDNISVFLGDGSGGFSTQTTFAAGSRPVSVAAGNFNGDTIPDLAVANYFGNNISVLLGNGSGGFGTQTTYATGTASISVAVGNFNGDTIPDLAVANFGSNNISVLLGDGSGGFGTQTTYSAGTGPRSVAVGNLNGDTIPDLAVANYTSSNISVLLGNGSGSFGTQTTYATGTNPFSVEVGNFNGDTLPDIVVTNHSSGNISVFLNTPPKITAVTATTADGTYGVGAAIAITVTFDQIVTVTGTPRLQLETGTTDQFATYASGSGTNVLTFQYAVQAGDSAPDLEYLSINALELNGGTIKGSDNFDALLTLPALASPNSLGGSKAIAIDSTPPSVTLSSTSPPATNAPFPVTATFSESVAGFDSTDVTVGNGTASNFTVVDATTYTFTVTPTGDGGVTVDVPAASATDTAGNNNTAAIQLTRTYDKTAPTASATFTDITAAGGTPYQFTVTYTDSTGIDAATLDGNDIRVTSTSGFSQLATLVSSNLAGNTLTATYSIAPPGGSWNVGANGTYTVAIAASQVSDIVGNAVTAADLGTFAVNIPNTPPTLGVAIAPQTAALSQAFNFQVPADAFSETDPGDSLTYSAKLADGSPLPAWLNFDPTTGTFSGTPAALANYNITVTATDKSGAAVSSTFALQANYDKEQAAQTVELGLDKLEQSLDASLLAANLPVAGNNLKASAPTLLDDLARILGGGLRSASVLNESNLQTIVQQAIAAEYPDAQVAGTTDPSEGTVQINFTKEFDVATALSDNLGLPALGLTASGNGNTKYVYDFSLGLGINKDYGLYIDPAKSSLKVKTGLSFDPAFTARSTMGLVPVDYIIDPANPSGFIGDYSGSFKDLDNLGLADDGSRLTLKELQSQFDLPSLFDTTIVNFSNLGLKGTTNNAGDAAIPTYTFDLKVGSDSFSGVPPSVQINNVVLDLGTFISDFAKPVFQKINEIIEPFRPVIDALNTDTKIFSELGIADLFDTNSDGTVTILELAATVLNATFDTSFFDAITKIDAATRIVNEIANTQGTIQIKRGDFTLDNIDIRSAADLASASISEVGVEEPTEKTYSILGFELEEKEDTPEEEQTKVEKFFGAVEALQGIGLPILTDPKSAVGLLIGKPDVPLFTYDMPTLQLNLSVSKDFPVWGPIVGLIEGEFKGRAYLKFGYDSWGLTQWKQSGWAAADAYKALDGFYVSDRENADGTGEDVPELSLEASIAAGLGIDAVFVAAYLKGGIQGTAEIDFRDVGEGEAVAIEFDPIWGLPLPTPIYVPGTGDGKIRAGEITSRLATPWELFQTEGSIDVFLAAEVQTGISIPFIGKLMTTVWSRDLATFNLAKFTVGPEGNSFTTAWDGYMAAGEVFFDANFNGIRDASEPGTFSNVDGTSSLDVPLPQFDTNGNGTLDPLEGRIVMADAVDVATLLPQATPLYTLPGWAAISPLTTIATGLVLLGNSVADAQAKVSAALGLPAGVDVTQYDALAAMAAGDASGLAVFAAAIQVQNTLVHIAKYVDATSQATIAAISDATIAAISTKLNAGTAVNFADPQVILELFQAAIASTAQLDPALNTAQLLSAASAAASVTALGNQIVQEIAASGASPADAALKITQLQAVSVGEIATGLADLAAGTVTPEQFLANNTKESIQQRMLQVEVTNPTKRPVIGEEVNTPYDGSLDGSIPGETPVPFPPVSPIGEGNVSTEPTPEADSLTGSDDAEEIFALAGDDTVLGNGGSDVINGNAGNDTIDGGDGDDFIYGGKDADTLTGAAGNDTLYGNLGTDSLEGGDGNDLLNGNQNEDWVDGGAGDDTVYGGKDGDTVLGGAGNDLAIGDMGADSVLGGDGDDVMFGNTGNDLLDGGAGNDLIFGGKDNDTILGGEGDDVLFGDMGDDSVLGGDGNDVIFGNTGNDLLDGGAGNDTAYGGKDNDTVVGGAGNDFLWGDMGDDSAVGGEGNDVLYGNTGADSLDGGEGDDSLYGGKDADALTGGEGNDWLSGDLGNDTLTGGAGSDRFVLTATGASDAIADFEDGTDKLVLGVSLTIEQLSVTSNGSSTAISVANSGELLVTLNNVQSSLIAAEDFVQI